MEQLGGAIIGGLLSGDGGGSTQTSERSPWAPAQPWLKNNITQGQALQNQYMANPFSQQQQSAFSNAFGMSDAYREMLPQLLQGLNTGQFDRTNPLKRPMATDYSAFKPRTTNMGGFQMPTMQTAAPAPQPAPASDGGFYFGDYMPNIDSRY